MLLQTVGGCGLSSGMSWSSAWIGCAVSPGPMLIDESDDTRHSGSRTRSTTGSTAGWTGICLVDLAEREQVVDPHRAAAFEGVVRRLYGVVALEPGQVVLERVEQFGLDDALEDRVPVTGDGVDVGLQRRGCRHRAKATVGAVAVYALGDKEPQVHADAFVHPDATVIGDVTIGAESTIWPQAVLRGDYGFIRVGARTSIQDGTVIHCTAEHPTIIGDDCVVGHLAHLECCTVEDGALVGTELGRAAPGRRPLGCAGRRRARSCPTTWRCRRVRWRSASRRSSPLDAVDPATIAANAAGYVRNGRRFRAELRRLDEA